MSQESGKDKVERNYRELDECVQGLAEDEIAKIRKKMDALKKEAARVGENVEAEIGESDGRSPKKKG